jgi:NAD(P)H dehydrogenase (quinone)
MRIVISGASGHFGSVATELLLDRIPPSDLTLVSRKPEQLARFAGLGVAVRYGDFDDPGALEKAFAGGDTLLLISGVKVGHRIPQHTRAIEAARAAGIGRIVYTSYLGTGPENTALVNKDHYGTEQVLMRSGTDWTIMRDGFIFCSDDMVSFEHEMRRGRYEITSKHIRQLTGRPPRTFRQLAAGRRGMYLTVAAEASG